MREMTSKGDPMLRTVLPNALIDDLKHMAKKNKRRVQDEIIKRLNQTFTSEKEYQLIRSEMQQQLKQRQNLTHYAQMVSQEMYQALNNAAREQAVNISDEVATRLLATFETPKTFNLNMLSEIILQYKFLHKTAVTESERNKHINFYRYELEKLRLYLTFKAKLPRHVKEEFSLIDVKEATKQIEKELKELEEQEKEQEKRLGKSF